MLTPDRADLVAGCGARYARKALPPRILHVVTNLDRGSRDLASPPAAAFKRSGRTCGGGFAP
jgi:hypothetical protein